MDLYKRKVEDHNKTSESDEEGLFRDETEVKQSLPLVVEPQVETSPFATSQIVPSDDRRETYAEELHQLENKPNEELNPAAHKRNIDGPEFLEDTSEEENSAKDLIEEVSEYSSKEDSASVSELTEHVAEQSLIIYRLPTPKKVKVAVKVVNNDLQLPDLDSLTPSEEELEGWSVEFEEDIPDFISSRWYFVLQKLYPEYPAHDNYLLVWRTHQNLLNKLLEPGPNAEIETKKREHLLNEIDKIHKIVNYDIRLINDRFCYVEKQYDDNSNNNDNKTLHDITHYDPDNYASPAMFEKWKKDEEADSIVWIDISPADISRDLSFIREGASALCKEHGITFGEQELLDVRLAVFEHRIFIAKDGGKAVGYLRCVLVRPPVMSMCYLEIDSVYICPDYRGYGVDDLLMKHFEFVKSQY